MKRFFRNNLWSILWGVIILVLTLMPGGMFPKIPSWIDRFHPDKLVHFFIFGIFALLLWLGFRKEGNPAGVLRFSFLLALFVSIALGASTEMIQGWFIPFRTADWGDFASDVVGTLAGLGIAKGFVGVS